MSAIIAPSVKSLMRRLNIDKRTADRVRAILKSPEKRMFACGKEECESMTCYPLRFAEKLCHAMEDANTALDFFGVEHMCCERANRSYFYLNTGDTYKCTIIKETGSNRFFLSDIGTIIERQDRNVGD